MDLRALRRLRCLPIAFLRRQFSVNRVYLPQSRSYYPSFEQLERRSLFATLTAGDIAFTGFQSVTTDKVSFVLLKSVDAGTVLTVTDKSWTGTGLLSSEGNSVITFGSTFNPGTQFNFDASRPTGRRWFAGLSNANISDVTVASFALAAGGDNLFAFNGNVEPTSGNSSLWVAGFTSTSFITTGTASAPSSYLPSALTLGTTAKSLGLATNASNQNGALTSPLSISGTSTTIASTINGTATWTTFTTANGQPVPSLATFSLQSSSNSPPTGLTLTGNLIAENQTANSIIGSLTTTDSDTTDSFTYSLVIGAGSTDNANFNINGSALQTSSVFDFETKSTYFVRIRTTDRGGLFFENAFTIQVTDVGENNNLRMVSYNIATADGTPRTGLDTILAAIGSEVVGGISKQLDLIALQEVQSQATTTAAVASLMNSLYGAGIYATGTLNGATTGSGTQGVVYNTRTLQLIGEKLIGTTSSTGQPRQTIRHQFVPVGGDALSQFYVYNSHWKSADDAESRNRRLIEAQTIRADADALGNGVNIIYVGDFNTYRSSETSFQEMISAGNGQAVDPINRLGSWSNNSSFRDILTQAPSNSPPAGFTSGGLDDRFDFQLNSGELTDGVGLEYRSGSYRTFGNNGSVALNGSINDASSTALAGLANRTTVLNLLTTVADHLPVVADYTFTSAITVVTPILTVIANSKVYDRVSFVANTVIAGANSPTPSITYEYSTTSNFASLIAPPTSVGSYFVRAKSATNSTNNAAQSNVVPFAITPKALTGTITVADKTFDGTNAATITGRSLTGVLSGDSVNYFGGVATFDNSDIGTAKTVTAVGLVLSGPDMNNYSVSSSATTTANINARLPASVVTRKLFYNGGVGGATAFGASNNFASTGGNPPATAIDSKVPLLPGSNSSFGNYSSVVFGINGIIVDIANAFGSLTIDDFNFATGGNSSSSGFTTLAGASLTAVNPQVTQYVGGGLNGSTRSKITFSNGSLTNTWLRVTVLANANTGLQFDDVFYFGNAVGDTDGIVVSGRYSVNVTDSGKTRQNLSSSVLVTSVFDFNKNGAVDAADTTIVRNAQSTFGKLLVISNATGPNLLVAAASPAVSNSLSTPLVRIQSVSPLSNALEPTATPNADSVSIPSTLPTAIVTSESAKVSSDFVTAPSPVVNELESKIVSSFDQYFAVLGSTI